MGRTGPPGQSLCRDTMCFIWALFHLCFLIFKKILMNLLFFFPNQYYSLFVSFAFSVLKCISSSVWVPAFSPVPWDLASVLHPAM